MIRFVHAEYAEHGSIVQFHSYVATVKASVIGLLMAVFGTLMFEQ